MRYMLTGDHWSTEEGYRIGEVQQVAPTQKRRWRQEFRSQIRSLRVGRSKSRQHCFLPIWQSIPPKPTLCPDWKPSLAHSCICETFRKDEKLKLKAARRFIRIDDPSAPLMSLASNHRRTPKGWQFRKNRHQLFLEFEAPVNH